MDPVGLPRSHGERQGEQVGRDHVARLMRQEGIRGAKRRGKPWRTTTPDPQAQKRADLVKRDFTADRPDALWVGDLPIATPLVKMVLRGPVELGQYTADDYTAFR